MRTPDLAFFQALEESLHQAETRRSADRLRELLADGFVEFGASGNVYGKTQVTTALAQESASGKDAASIEAYDFAMRAIAADTVLLTYRSTRRSVGQDQARHALRSSLWQLIDGRWQMLFHQGTIIPEE